MSTMRLANLLCLSPPDSGGDHGVSPPHGGRLEDVWHLRVDGLVVASPAKVGAVAFGAVIIWDPCAAGELAGQEQGQPLVKDNMLVGGDGQLSGSVEQPLVLLCQMMDPLS